VFRRNNEVVASVKGTTAFEIALARCRNFVIAVGGHFSESVGT
jgi:hypothetical protein